MKFLGMLASALIKGDKWTIENKNLVELMQ